MTGRTKFFLSLLGLIAIFIAFEFYLFINHGPTTRPEQALLNQYFKLKNKDPKAAKRALDLILEEHPTNQTALRELGYWYLREGKLNEALEEFLKASANDPNDALAREEVRQLYTLTGQSEKSCPYFPLQYEMKQLALGPTLENYKKQYDPIHEISSPIIEVKKSPTPLVTVQSSTGTMTERDKLLNKFYEDKKNNPTAAWNDLETLLKYYPKDVIALKEAGYFALNQKNNRLAFYYFKQVYDLTHDPYIALQNGYILSALGENKLAYDYFSKATRNPNLADSYKAEIALTNLRGMDIKLLPDPFFVDVFFNPFYFSRFHLIVYPIIAKAGITLNSKYNLQAYLGYRRNTDNKSGSSGAISQIYEDNVAIMSVGLQGTPFPKIPLSAFIEGGRAKDLVYQNRGRWRGDFRTGFAYFTEWGREAEYTFKPNFPMRFEGDIYADAIYYSRFTNTIATLRARPGFEVFRLNASSVDIYFRAFAIEDTKREFFNNYYELGPGIVFIPSDRYNVALRYEFVQGHYLPASSTDSPNPYGAKYHNNIVEFDFFGRF